MKRDVKKILIKVLIFCGLLISLPFTNSQDRLYIAMIAFTFYFCVDIIFFIVSKK